MDTIYKKLLENNIMLLHKAASILQIVVIIYDKERKYSLYLSHIICELVYYSKYSLT